MTTIRAIARWLDQDIMRAFYVYAVIAMFAIAIPQVFGPTGLLIGVIIALVQTWFWQRIITGDEFGWEILLDALENWR